jgi:hypothetical protein
MQRDRLAQQPHAALRSVVGGEIMPADQPRDRRDVDDRAAAALEESETVFAAEECAIEIDGKNLSPGCKLGFFDVAQCLESGGVD